MSKTKKTSAKKKQRNVQVAIWKTALVSLLVSLAVWLLMLVVFSGACVKMADSSRLILPLGFASALLGAASGGFISGKIGKSAGLVMGLCVGVMFCAVLLVCSFAVGNSGLGFVAKGAFCCGILLCAALFGGLGARPDKPKSRTRTRR